MPATRTTRDEILEAALIEFNAHGGVAATTIEDICLRSGASVGSLYHFFGGKIELAAVLYLEALSDYQDGFLDVIEGADGARDGVEQAVHYHLTWVSDNAELARFLFLGSEQRITRIGDSPLRRLNRRFFQRVRAWMEPRVKRGELRALSTETLTALWIGPSQELARHWLAGRMRTSPTTAAPELADAAWRCLCPSATTN